jgi:hypothetical protein
LQVADLLRQIASLQRPVCCDASEGTDPFEGKQLLCFSFVSHLFSPSFAVSPRIVKNVSIEIRSDGLVSNSVM